MRIYRDKFSLDTIVVVVVGCKRYALKVACVCVVGGWGGGGGGGGLGGEGGGGGGWSILRATNRANDVRHDNTMSGQLDVITINYKVLLARFTCSALYLGVSFIICVDL